MPIALSVLSVDYTRRKKVIRYKPTFSGAYATGGDTLDLTVATNPKFIPGALASPRVPDSIDIEGAPGGNPAEAVLGASNTVHKVKMFASTNTELAAGAYNAAISGDANITIEVKWPIGV